MKLKERSGSCDGCRLRSNGCVMRKGWRACPCESARPFGSGIVLVVRDDVVDGRSAGVGDVGEVVAG